MIEELFTKLTLALSGNVLLALTGAFGWGILSILLSPCHLASIPLVVGLISRQEEVKVKQTFVLALLFALGILITIAIIGIITAGLGRLMGDVGPWGTYLVVGIFIIIGLYLMDIIRLDWNRLNMSNSRQSGLWGAFILGLLFGLGLGPCTFAFLAPVLGIVFKTAANNWLHGILLILSFATGHCAVITAAGSLSGVIQKYLEWNGSSGVIKYLRRLAGFLVLCAGFYYLYQQLV